MKVIHYMPPPLFTRGRVFRHKLDDDHVSLFVATLLLVLRSETAFAITLRRSSITNACISSTKIHIIRVRLRFRVRVRVRGKFWVRFRVRVRVRVKVRGG